jgi:hypothetical protein
MPRALAVQISVGVDAERQRSFWTRAEEISAAASFIFHKDEGEVSSNLRRRILEKAHRCAAIESGRPSRVC